MKEEHLITVNHKLLVRMIRKVKIPITKLNRLGKDSIINCLGYLTAAGKRWFWLQENNDNWNRFSMEELWKLYKQLITTKTTNNAKNKF